jgi:site-specific recombinase XerD
MKISQARREYISWMEAARDLSQHTIRAYDSDIAALERHVGRLSRVGEINRASILSFFEGQRMRGLSPLTLRRRTSGVRSFCQWLMSRQLLDADPMRDAEVTISGFRRLPRVVPTDELNRLLLFLREAAAASDNPHPREAEDRPHEFTTLLAVTLMVATGVRVSEAVSIRCENVELSSRTLRLLGKGRRERQVFLTDDWITSLVNAHLIARRGLGVSHGSLLFNLHYEPLSAPALRGRLAKAAQAAGLEARVTPHMLRHTAATKLIEAGVDIRYIQRLLGHASLSTTEIYTHVSDHALQRVVSSADVLGRSFRSDN